MWVGLTEELTEKPTFGHASAVPANSQLSGPAVETGFPTRTSEGEIAGIKVVLGRIVNERKRIFSSVSCHRA